MFKQSLILLLVVVYGSCNSINYDDFDEKTTTEEDLWVKVWTTTEPATTPDDLFVTKWTTKAANPTKPSKTRKEETTTEGIFKTNWPTPKPPSPIKCKSKKNCFDTNPRLADQVDCGKGANVGKKCVSWYLCNKNNSVNTGGDFLIDERLDTGMPKQKLCPSLFTCCRFQDETVEVVLPPDGGEPPFPEYPDEPNTTSPVPDTTDYPNSEEDKPRTTQRPAPGKTEVPRPPLRDLCKTGEIRKPTRCGLRNVDGLTDQKVQKINEDEGDKYAQFGEFPWMMAVFYQVEDEDGNPDWEYRCGGSLIHSKVVLTAAHSLYGLLATELKVRGAEWESKSIAERCPHHERYVKDMIDNDYEPRTKNNNIMMLVLKKAFELTAAINIICLPEDNWNFEKSFQNECFGTGWGTENFGEPKFFQNFLKKVDMPVVPRGTCQKQLNSTELHGGSLVLGPTMLCAGGEKDKDMCSGDGGGPLACKNPKRRDKEGETYYLAGIVTGGVPGGCGQANKPGIYENVVEHVTWIEKQINDLGLSSDY